ncbi:fused MFS/spermidine synthase [Candidatus Uhrbacteria bacterium]|nr:fused MFS/spermidine synthase [Candidatus Uhrbacteria bacterium]
MKSQFRSKYLLTIAFVAGMSIMAMEIGASRLIAPFFGTSLFVWTNVIGVVMIALSIGYYIGGKLADKKPELKMLLWLLCIAGLMFAFVPFAAAPLAIVIKLAIFETASASTMIMLGSFLLILILFAMPLLLLGMVSPYVIKLYADDEAHLGEQAGSIFALSTVGSILGTFLPTLWLIPTVGTRWTILIFALILIVVSGVGLYRDKRYILLVIVFAIFGSFSMLEPVSARSIYRGESVYQYIEVIEDDDDRRMLLFNEGLGVQSVFDPEDIFLGMYYDYYLPLPELFEDEVNVGIIGLAGGSLSRAFTSIYGDRVAIDGVEIDKKVIEVAREYFELDQPSLTVFNEDGRLFVERKQSAYDLLIIDAYTQQLYIPFTMTTQEFWRDAELALKDGGVVALNMNATSLEAPLLSAISNTVSSVFSHTYVVPLTHNASWNYIVLASNGPINLELLHELELEEPLNTYANVLSSQAVEFVHDPEQLVLTDDRAPIELMTEEMIIDYYFEH